MSNFPDGMSLRMIREMEGDGDDDEPEEATVDELTCGSCGVEATEDRLWEREVNGALVLSCPVCGGTMKGQPFESPNWRRHHG